MFQLYKCTDTNIQLHNSDYMIWNAYKFTNTTKKKFIHWYKFSLCWIQMLNETKQSDTNLQKWKLQSICIKKDKIEIEEIRWNWMKREKGI